MERDSIGLQAKALGASALLLIARALPQDGLERMMDAARRVGIEALVEVRDEEELERALRLNAAIVGVNNRNLETLEIDLDPIVVAHDGGL